MNRTLMLIALIAAMRTGAIAQSGPDEWGALPLSEAPGLIGGGGTMIDSGDERSLLVIQGNNTQGFFRYAVDTGAWEILADTPLPVESGGAIASDRAGTIYAIFGTSPLELWRFAIPGELASGAGQWEWLGLVPWIGECHLAWAQGSLYAFRGNNFAELFRISNDWGTWTSLGKPPSVLNARNLMAYPGSGDHLFIFRTAYSRTLVPFCLSTGRWNEHTDGTPFLPPSFQVNGEVVSFCCPMEWDSIYVKINSSFRAYSRPSPSYPQGSWSDKKSAPVAGGAGTALGYPGVGPYLYALQGGQNPSIWRYQMETGSGPETPSMAGQYRSNGEEVLVGGTILGEFVARTPAAADPDGHSLRLEVEVKPVGVGFDGLGTVLGPFVASGEDAEAAISGLAAGQGYHWRVRRVDRRGDASPSWFHFGSNSDPGDVDVSVRANAPPALTAAGQFLIPGRIPIEIGQVLLDTAPVVRFEATIIDPDGDDSTFEIRVDQANPVMADVPSGGAASITLTLALGAHQWEYRAVDALGLGTDWVRYGGAGPAFELAATPPPGGSIGNSGCVQSAAGPVVLASFLLLLLAAPGRRRS